MSAESDNTELRVLSNTVARFETEVKEQLASVRVGQDRNADRMETMRNELPERFLSRREHEDWRRTVGERIGEVEIEALNIRKDMQRELDKRDDRLDANHRLAISGLLFPIVSGITVGIVLVLIRLLTG
jgi:hypothetical protein